MAKVIKSSGVPPTGIDEIELGTISPDTGFADIARKKAGVVSKDVYDANNEAKKIILEAEQKATEILQEAENQAQLVIAQAEEKGQEILINAKDEGLKQGADQAAAQYTEAVLEHSRRMDQKEAEVANQVRQLSLAIAKKIIGRELELSPDIVVDMAKKHLISVRQRREVYLRVGVSDLEVLREHKRELLEQLGRAKEIEIRADEALSQGSMIIETEAGTIDAKLETQLQVIERILMSK